MSSLKMFQNQPERFISFADIKQTFASSQWRTLGISSASSSVTVPQGLSKCGPRLEHQLHLGTR